MPSRKPENAVTLRCPIPAETFSGTTWASARITVSATALPEQKRAITGAGKRGFASVPSGAVIPIGRKSPEFVGTGSCVAVSSRMERMVKSTATSTVPSNGMLIGRSTCDDVPGQVDMEVRALDGQRHANHQIAVAGVRVVEETVQIALGDVRAVRQSLDLAPQHALGVVHEILARGAHRLDAVAPDEVEEALRTDSAGGDLCLHVPDDEPRRTDVVAQEAPHPLVAPAFLLDLDRSELEALRVRIRRVDDPARAGVSAPRSRWCAVVAENATSSPSWKIGTTKATSGPCEAP